MASLRVMLLGPVGIKSTASMGWRIPEINLRQNRRDLGRNDVEQGLGFKGRKVGLGKVQGGGARVQGRWNKVTI